MISYRRRIPGVLWLGLTAFMGLMGPDAAYAQQVKAAFNIHLETLPLVQQEEMRGFDRKLVDYVEGWNWMNDDLPDPVQFQMEAFLAYQGSIVKTQYGSKLTVSNGLDIKYLDRWWFFEFERDDILRHDDLQFHPLTWLIDYYVHLMIGHELDKYDEFGGEAHFKRAQEISMSARFSREYQKGWDERLVVMENILADDYKPYRRLRMLFHKGITLHHENHNEEAKVFCRQAVDLLAAQYDKNPGDERIKAFFGAHYLALADVFKTEATPDVYRTLLRIDPDHKATYTDYINNLGR
jgi:hypothetical protein